MPALYVDHLQGFVANDAEQLLGRLTVRLAEEGFPSTTDNTFSWMQEIAELQAAFRGLIELVPRSKNWRLLLEYVLPVVGQRVDCILLANSIIFVIEYKGMSGSRLGKVSLIPNKLLSRARVPDYFGGPNDSALCLA